ncbi:phosphotransferase enzyme family protein [Catellatospora bangladeshensis]|uniref:phosphotransferase enzyme family protein n=1 Tax=Catellatospora bangladeshensis TaxID=310355 RepID=UPI00194262F6|nr:phosphotransferase [Catellatospora bangladeshensis]
MLADDTIRTALRTAWHLQPDGCTPLDGGTAGSAGSVVAGGRRYVAALVAAVDRTRFEAGLAAAERLARQGHDAGAPVRAADGALCVPVGDRLLALLEYVPGRPLDGADPVDQQWWGDRLGAAHRALAGFHHAGLPAWHGLRPDAPHLAVAAWLGPAVARAVHAMTKLQVTDRLTVGTLHGAPRPAAFRLDPDTGRIGLVSWGSVLSGPLVYDLAAAVRHAGGPERARELLAAYTATGAVPVAEIEGSLDTMLRFCWAAEADACARLLAGCPGSEPDRAAVERGRAGLDQARAALLD